MKKETEEVYEYFWKIIVEKDGNINIDAIKKELHDYYIAIQEVGKVYDYITMGKLTKPNTDAQYIIDELEKRFELKE
jgi:hypothetical protein